MFTKEEIRKMDVSAIEKEIAAKQLELTQLTVQIYSGQSKETGKPARLRKYIALLNTIKKELSNKSDN